MTGAHDMTCALRGRRRSALRAGLLALAIAGVVAAPASAATATITFDDQPAGTKLTNEYSALGITFARDYFDKVERDVTVQNVGAAVAYSGANVATAFVQCFTEFCAPGTSLHANFERPKQFVALRVGFTTPGPAGRVLLTTYDVNGQPRTRTVEVGYGVRTFARVDAVGGEGLVAFHVHYDDAGRGPAGIDQLQFDVPDSGVTPPPDFGIARTDNGLDVGLKRGASLTVPFRVTRFGSSGPIDLQASGMPDGVTVDFSPVRYTNNSRVGSFTATFRAEADAPPADKTTVAITATPTTASAGALPRKVNVPVTVQAHYNIAVLPPEIIQAVSEGTGSYPWDLNASVRSIAYKGLPLVARKRTTVRAYASVSGAPPSGVPVDGLLYGSRDGKPLPGSPLRAEQGTQKIVNGAEELKKQRGDLSLGFTFTLPPEWTTGGPIALTYIASGPVAGIALGGGAPPLVECESCRADNSFTKTDVRFVKTRPYTIRPVWMPWTRQPARRNQNYDLLCSLTPDQITLARGAFGDDAGCLTEDPATGRRECRLPTCSPLRDPAAVVRQFQASAPVSDGNLTVLAPAVLDQSFNARRPYDEETNKDGKAFDANADGGDVKNSEALNQLALNEVGAWLNREAGALSSSITLGINEGLARGVAWKLQNILGNLAKPLGVDGNNYPLAVIDQNNTGVDMHEIGHALGRAHASFGCDGGKNGQVAEDWTTIDGSFGTNDLGLDIGPAIGGLPAVQRLIGFGQPAAGYDAMSYCAGAGVPWISPKGWMQEVKALEENPAAAAITRARHDTLTASARRVEAAAARRGRAFVVRGFVTASGKAYIAGSQELPRGTAPPTKGAPFKARLVDARGRRFAAVTMNVTRTHIDAPAAPRPLVVLGADLPARAARRAGGLEVLNGGKVIARRKRSRNAPRARLFTPRVVRGKPTLIRYRASDRDRGDKLTVTIEYAASGRRYRTIYRGPASRRGLRVAPGTIGGGRRARLRLTVDDGWNRTRARSVRIRGAAARPRALLVWPLAQQEISSRASLYLHGLGIDEQGGNATSLRWYVGRRLIARGRQASVRGLRPGRRIVRLVVRDRRGRTSSASVPVLVRR